jgi:hypothetical protein
MYVPQVYMSLEIILLPHYWSRLLCRGPQTLGKASQTLDKAFAKCSSRQSGLGKNPIGKAFFAESRLSGSLPRASAALGNEKAPLTGPQRLPSLPRAHLAGSRQRVFLCFLEKTLCREPVWPCSRQTFFFFFKNLPRVLLVWLSVKYFSFF